MNKKTFNSCKVLSTGTNILISLLQTFFNSSSVILDSISLQQCWQTAFMSLFMQGNKKSQGAWSSE